MIPKGLSIHNLLKNPTTWIFFICTIIIFFTQFILLQSILQFGLLRIPDDWSFLLVYKSLSELSLFDKFFYIWVRFGLHNSTNVLWMGMLSYFFDTHYQAFQTVNVLVKILSVISLFPLILIIFKNRLLAFLATVFYGINSGATGSLFWVMNGNQYAAIALMNIFFTFYYYAVAKNSKLLLFLASPLFFITYVLAPTRMFFLFLIIPITEFFWLLQVGFLRNLHQSILRVITFFIPAIIFAFQISISNPDPLLKQPSIVFGDIIDGNWHLLLYPFASIGNSILTNDYWRFLGNLSQDTFSSFGSYLFFIATGPLITFTILTAILSKVLSKTPGKFFVLIFGLNLIFEIVMFFISTHHFNISKSLIADYNPSIFLISKYPTLLAIYIFSVAIGCFLEWKKDQNNKLLLACWAGPLFSALYIWPMWVFAGPLLASYSSVNHLSYYLIISPIGLSVFLSAILTLAFEKSKNRNVLHSFVLAIIVGIIFILYSTYGSEIRQEFMVNDPISQPNVKIEDQERFYNMLAKQLGSAIDDGDLLVYFEFPDDVSSAYYQRILATHFFGNFFGESILYRRSSAVYGCVGGVFDKSALVKAVVNTNNSSGFLYQGSCRDRVTKSYGRSGEVLYSLNNFHAFKVINDKLIDIKGDVLKQLQIY